MQRKKNKNFFKSTIKSTIIMELRRICRRQILKSYRCDYFPNLWPEKKKKKGGRSLNRH